MSLELLNTDVLETILQYASRETVKMVSLCSRSYRAAALPLLFRRLSFALEDSIRIRQDLAESTFRMVKELHLRIHETSKAICQEDEAGDDHMQSPVVQAIRLESSFPVKTRSYEALKDILHACHRLGDIAAEATGGRADWSGTEYSPVLYAYTVVKCLGACHVTRDNAHISLKLSPSHWLSTTVNTLNAAVHHQFRIVELTLRDTRVSPPVMLAIANRMSQLQALRLDHCEVRSAVDWWPGGFVVLKKLSIHYRGFASDPISLEFHRNLLGYLAPQLEELEICGTLAMVEGPESYLSANLQSLPKLRTLSSSHGEIRQLLLGDSIPKVVHLEVRHARENPSSSAYWSAHKSFFVALCVNSPVTLACLRLEEARPKHIYFWLSLSRGPPVDYAVNRLRVERVSECSQAALARSRHLIIEKGIEVGDLRNIETLACHELETIEFADDREENAAFLARLYSPELMQVTVTDNFEY